jgi:uncharacterized protein (TIGR02444 family)
MSYWDWAIEAHGREGVDAALIELQDVHGQCVAYLLWAAWAANEGRPLASVILAQGAALARHWEAGATGPLRQARRGLKASAPPIDDEARTALREQVRSAEFTAERLLMETLEGLAPEPEGAAIDVGQAMAAASAAWGPGPPQAGLKDLAVRLEVHG